MTRKDGLLEWHRQSDGTYTAALIDPDGLSHGLLVITKDAKPLTRNSKWRVELQHSICSGPRLDAAMEMCQAFVDRNRSTLLADFDYHAAIRKRMQSEGE